MNLYLLPLAHRWISQQKLIKFPNLDIMITPECHVRDKGFSSSIKEFVLFASWFNYSHCIPSPHHPLAPPIPAFLPFSVSLAITQSFIFCLLTLFSFLQIQTIPLFQSTPNTHPFSHIYFHQLFPLSCILTVFLMTPVFPKHMFLYSARIFLLPLFFLWTLILITRVLKKTVIFIAFICMSFIYLSLSETKADFEVPPRKVCLSFI